MVTALLLLLLLLLEADGIAAHFDEGDGGGWCGGGGGALSYVLIHFDNIAHVLPPSPRVRDDQGAASPGNLIQVELDYGARRAAKREITPNKKKI